MLNKEKTKGFIAGAITASIITGAAVVFASPVEQMISVVYDNYRIIIDGADKSKALEDSKPFIFNGRTYVPLRYVGEAMGKKVLWDGETKSIYINDEGNLREDVYFATQGYEKSDKGIYLDGNTNCVYMINTSGSYSDSFEENGITYRKRSIVFNLNGLSKSVLGTIDMSETKNNDSEGKVIFYDQNDRILYQTSMMRNLTTPTPFEIQTSGVLQIRAEFINSAASSDTVNIKIKDFRYSK